MNGLNQIAAELVRLRENQKRSVRCFASLGLCLLLLFVLGAAAETSIHGSLAVLETLTCRELVAENAASLNGNVVVKKDFPVEGALTNRAITQMNELVEEQRKQIAHLEEELNDRKTKRVANLERIFTG